MIWKKLKEFCNDLTDEQLNETVRIIREEETISKIDTEVFSEDQVLDVEEPQNGFFPESEKPDPDMETKVAYKKGTPILWEEF